jgi:hypothetical protein
MNSVKKFLKNLDQFGTVIGLHFGNYIEKEDGLSPVFTTPIGGFFSLLS